MSSAANGKLESIAENIERLATIELNRSDYGRGVVQRLFEASVAAYGPNPTLQVAQDLISRVRLGSIVLMSTGAGGGVGLPFGESDGPMGTASVAVVLKIGLGAVPVVVTEPQYAQVIRETLRAFGLWPADVKTARMAPNHVALIELTNEELPGAIEELLGLDPAAVVVIEKPGANHLGVSHTATGRARVGDRLEIESLLAAATRAGVLTIGVGDNGNELGWGRIVEAVRTYKPYGDVCQCPCGGGIACVTETDRLIVANVSNWGAYALSATLALILRRPELLHDGEQELRALWACAQAGGADGRTGRTILAADGIPGRLHAHVVDLMLYMVTAGIQGDVERPF